VPVGYHTKVIIDSDNDLPSYSGENDMQATDNEKTGQTGTRHTDRLDRALTVGGYLTSPDGRYKDSTANLYAAAWSAFETWCHSTGRTPMPATPETIATYAVALLDTGYVPDTIKCRITAIRARHRIMGHPVPDNVPAWTVLCWAESSRVRPVVNGISRTDLLAAIRSCPDTTLGIRNQALALLAWDVLLPAPDIVALNVDDITDPWGDHPMTIQTSPVRDVDHDHTTAIDTTCPRCDAQPGEPCTWSTGIVDPGISHAGRDRAAGDTSACPACAIRAWVRELHLAGIRHGALFRPVDRLGVIARSGVRRSGSTAPDARLTVRSVHRVWARLVADSGITPCTPRALRLGGARDRVDRGEPVRSVIDRAAWSPNTASVVTRLM
jgi:hypothetical protein